VILALAALFVAALLYREYQHGKALEAERAEWRLERVALLNRIQAPEIEVAKQFDARGTKQFVGFDDDDAYWEAVNGD
jgi:hypothetical protein